MNRVQVLERLKARKSFIENQYLNRMTLNWYLNNINNGKLNIGEFFCSSYDILDGHNKRAIKFVSPNGEKDYLLCASKSSFTSPNQIAVGSEMNGKVYLLGEQFPMFNRRIYTTVVPYSEWFECVTSDLLPELEREVIQYDTPEKFISDDSMICINAADMAARRIGGMLKRTNSRSVDRIY